jgi:hypothetical protein
MANGCGENAYGVSEGVAIAAFEAEGPNQSPNFVREGDSATDVADVETTTTGAWVSATEGFTHNPTMIYVGVPLLRTGDENPVGEARDNSMVLPAEEVAADPVGVGSGAHPFPSNSPGPGDDHVEASLWEHGMGILVERFATIR